MRLLNKFTGKFYNKERNQISVSNEDVHSEEKMNVEYDSPIGELEEHLHGTEKKLDENLLDTMVPYADLMTLLLIFFVFFFIISDYEKTKMIVENQELMEKVNVDSLFDLNEKTITIPSEILFDIGKSDLKWKAKAALSDIAEDIKNVIVGDPKWQIRIEGHTDNVPIFTKQFASNWDLSTARALSVVKFFIDNSHFSPDQLQAMGYGEFKPLVPNNTTAHRKKNRRVEIKLSKKY